MSHFKLVEGGNYRCFITGGGTARAVEVGYVPGYTDDIIHIGAKSTEYLARAIGWVSAEDAEELRDQVAAQQAKIDGLEATLATAGIDAEATAAAKRLVGLFGALVEIVSDRGLMGRLVSAAPDTPRTEDPRDAGAAIEENDG